MRITTARLESQSTVEMIQEVMMVRTSRDSLRSSIIAFALTVFIGYPIAHSDLTPVQRGTDSICGDPVRLHHDDLEHGDNFGFRHTWMGDLLLVGGPGIGTRGGARLFDMSDPDNPQHLSTLLPVDPIPPTYAGTSVAMNGNFAFLGGWGDNNLIGAVWVYDISDPANPVFTQKLTPTMTQGGPEFGDSIIALDGELFVGAPFSPTPGHIYHYQVNADGQFDLFEIYSAAPDPSYPTLFGESFAIEDNLLLVGSPGQIVFVDGKEHSGAVHFFKRNETTKKFEWQSDLLANVVANEEVPFILGFAEYLHITDGIVFVTTSLYPGLPPHTGMVAMFDVSDSMTPTHLATIAPEDGDGGEPAFIWDRFGCDVARDCNTLYVAAQFADDGMSNAGAVFVYDISRPATPQLIEQWNPEIQEGGCFGVSIEIAGPMVTVGGNHITLDGSRSGEMFLYDRCIELGGCCDGDLNGDGTIDVRDLLQLLLHFGTEESGATLDFPLQIIDQADLLKLLSQWGDC